MCLDRYVRSALDYRYTQRTAINLMHAKNELQPFKVNNGTCTVDCHEV